MSKKKVNFYLERFFSILAAILLFQSLFFKFTAAKESVFIFNQLNMEPYGRIGIGIAELIIAILLFILTSLIGALLAIVVITGAFAAHLFVLGIEVSDDNGLLFGLALLVFVSSFIVISLQKKKLLKMVKTKRIVIG